MKFQAFGINPFFLLLCFLFTTLSIQAQTDSSKSKQRKSDERMLDKPKYYLLLDGRIFQSAVSEKGKQKELDSVKIRVLNETDFTMATRDAFKGTCEIKLPLGKKYTIEFSRRGFVSKIIEVNAIVPKFDMFVSVFPFDIDLFEEVEGLDVAVLSEPIAKITFNNFNKTFDYDFNYTVKINNNIKKLYAEYYRLQRLKKAAKKK
jgi:hypothetical protein